MNINETLIDTYSNLDINLFKQNGDYLILVQNQKNKLIY